VPISFAADDKGILPDRMIAELVRDGAIKLTRPPAADQIQPASLDLRLGPIAYRVRASFLPGPRTLVADRIRELTLHEIALGNSAVLETGCVYIVPLIESLALPDTIAAAANPKSSTGRLDVFTRVIADRTRGFDQIEAGYHGPLYAEISPRTFPVLVREGARLSQIRFRHGQAMLDSAALSRLHAQVGLVDSIEADVRDGIAVSVDLSGFPHPNPPPRAGEGKARTARCRCGGRRRRGAARRSP
jgi:dCTP deaminase